jgi:stage III sporulation protein AF
MKESIFLWIRNIAYYMILVTAMVQVIPNNSYKKYIRLFTGMVFILLLTTPILKLFGVFQEEITLDHFRKYQEKMEEIEEMQSMNIEIENVVIGE